MAAWKLKDANDTWDTVCERAYAGEPQYLTRDGVSFQIIITLAPQRVEVQQKPSVIDVLTSCPCDISDLVQTSSHDEESSFDKVGGFKE